MVNIDLVRSSFSIDFHPETGFVLELGSDAMVETMPLFESVNSYSNGPAWEAMAEYLISRNPGLEGIELESEAGAMLARCETRNPLEDFQARLIDAASDDDELRALILCARKASFGRGRPSSGIDSHVAQSRNASSVPIDVLDPIPIAAEKPVFKGRAQRRDSASSLQALPPRDRADHASPEARQRHDGVACPKISSPSRSCCRSSSDKLATRSRGSRTWPRLRPSCNRAWHRCEHLPPRRA